MERVKVSTEMQKIAENVIKDHPQDFRWIEDEDIAIAYLESSMEKKTEGRRVFGECKKAEATLKEIGGCDFVIKFYKPNMGYMTDKQKYILMYHELLHIATKDSDECVIKPHDYVVGEFKKVIGEFGLDWATPGCKSEDMENESV
jgi:predicted metallopeptidase